MHRFSEQKNAFVKLTFFPVSFNHLEIFFSRSFVERSKKKLISLYLQLKGVNSKQSNYAN